MTPDRNPQMELRHPQRERLWSSGTWPFIASVLALMTCIAFESFAVSTVLPVVVADLGNTEWYSFAYAATITTGLIGMVIGGNWCDRSGPRTPLWAGGTLFLLGLVLSVAAPDTATFIVGRLVQGIGGGIDSVVLYVLIARRIPEEARPKMFGLLTTAWLIPSLAGPVVAGTLAELTHWRTVFAIIFAGAAVSLLCLLHATRTLDHMAEPSTSENSPLRSSIIGRNGATAVLAAGLLCVLHLSGQLPAPFAAVIVIGASVMLVVIARSILPPGTLLLRGAPQRLIVLRAVLGAAVTATNLYLTLYLQTVRGYLPATAGLIIAICASGWALGAWIQGQFPNTWTSHRRLLLIATLLVAAGPATVLAYTCASVPLWAVIAGCAAMGTGMGTSYPRLSSATLALARPEEHGAYSSALQAGESMSIGATTALIAAAFSGGASFTAIYAILVLVACAAIMIAYRE